MTAVIGGRSLQEEETHRGNINVIMLMECTDENVPIDEEKAASKNVHAGRRTTGMMPFFFSTWTNCETPSSTAGHTLDSFTVEEPHQNPVFHSLCSKECHT